MKRYVLQIMLRVPDNEGIPNALYTSTHPFYHDQLPLAPTRYHASPTQSVQEASLTISLKTGLVFKSARPSILPIFSGTFPIFPAFAGLLPTLFP